MAQSAMLL
jgi:hypothetical protein